jgi:hypothetical protein
VCVYVRYKTYLNVVGMGSKLLGVLRRTLRWSSKSQKFKKLILKICFFNEETQKKRENGRGWESVTGAGTGNGLDPNNAGYPPLVTAILKLTIWTVELYHYNPDATLFWSHHSDLS